jgi:hypothetical protein
LAGYFFRRIACDGVLISGSREIVYNQSDGFIFDGWCGSCISVMGFQNRNNLPVAISLKVSYNNHN